MIKVRWYFLRNRETIKFNKINIVDWVWYSKGVWLLELVDRRNNVEINNKEYFKRVTEGFRENKWSLIEIIGSVKIERKYW